MLLMSGCLATGCDTRPEEVEYGNLTLIATLAEDAGMAIVRDEMPCGFRAEEAGDEISFMREAEKNNTTIIHVITMTQENLWTQKTISRERKYMAIGNGGRLYSYLREDISIRTTLAS